MTSNPPLKCSCEEPLPATGRNEKGERYSGCGYCGLPIPTAEPKSPYEECVKLSNELEVSGNKKLDDDLTERIATPPVEGEWKEHIGMKILNRWICGLKSILGGYPFPYYVSGHSFVEQEDGALECEMCGYKSI